MARRLFRSLAITLSAALAVAGAHAAELGDARVSSHIGQQLVADIELTMIESPAAKVEVRLADAEVYRGANVVMPEELSSLNMSVMQRDGRQFLHVTSLIPVTADHLHLYLELADGGHRMVRLSTLWLTPDPNPAPSLLPAPAAVAAPQPAPPVQVAPPVPVAQPAQPRMQAIAPIVARPPAKVNHPAIVPAAPAPAACVPVVPSSEAKACAALDAKNAALREKLGQLEQKMKGLQVALGSAPTPVPARAETAIRPKARPAAKRVEPEPARFPWMMTGIAGAVVAAAAGAGLFALARRKARKAKEMALRGGIKSRLMPGP